ncbi:MAG: SDR family oxidoreductase [Alphaproteobacteria bacterium]|nr:SDR family oxidoreductase [Alphaproteobacteria bacterium]
MKRRVVVTGGAGFIGSHLVDRLLADGNQVVVIDDFSVGGPRNLVRHQGGQDLAVHQMDIAKDDIAPLFSGAERVFHLAARADIVPSIVMPVTYFDANATGTMRVMEAARHAGVKRVLYTASSSCYGVPDHYPTPETAEIRPQYPYALTKWLGEQTVLHWGQVYGIPVVSLRFFNVYGPRVRTAGTYGAVFGVFLAQKLNGQPFTVVGDGTQTRDFTYVSDIVDAMVVAMDSDLAGVVMNVGSGEHHSVNRLVELLGGPVTHIPKRPGEPDCTFADTRRIETLLGWRAKVSFEQGVAAMLDNIDYWREAPIWTPETIKEATKEWFQFLK